VRSSVSDTHERGSKADPHTILVNLPKKRKQDDISDVSCSEDDFEEVSQKNELEIKPRKAKKQKRIKKYCRIPDCDKRQAAYCNGLCKKHWRNSHPDERGDERGPQHKPFCRFPKCRRISRGLNHGGMCRNHFTRSVDSALSSVSTSSYSSVEVSLGKDKMRCIIRGCNTLAHTNHDNNAICKKHLIVFGPHPPTEMKKICDDSGDHQSLYEEYENLYRYYKSTLGTGEWSNKLRRFIQVRKQIIRLAKKEQKEHIMNKRLAREEESMKLSPDTRMDRLLNGEHVIPASTACQITQNIRRQGVNTENIRNAVLAEAKRAFGLDDEGHDRKKRDSFYRQIIHHWSTCAENHCNHALASPPPPPPSQIDYLRNIIEAKLLNQKQFHQDTAQKLMERLDPSALLAIGVSIEEIMTKSLINHAKVHVGRHQGRFGPESKVDLQHLQQTINNEPVTKLIASQNKTTDIQ